MTGGRDGREDDDEVPPAVPRPPGAEPGDPAPWSALSAAARRRLSTAQLLERLAAYEQAGRPPDLEAWTAESASLLVQTWAEQAAVPAAVLVAIFEERGEARVVLTRRSTRLRAHRGQISFPGGRMEPGEDAWAAALREAAEEVGLDPSTLVPAGWLHPVVTRASSSLILPVVATLGSRPHLVANPNEVARVFDVALSELAADGVFSEERWHFPAAGRVRGVGYPVHFYAVAGETVWGATARLLTELVAVVLGVAPTSGRRTVV